MKKVTIYTNGTQLFTLQNYGKTAGVCHVNGITLYGQVSIIKARHMHSTGSLHYVSGIGDTKDLSKTKLYKGLSIGNFKVN